MTLEDRLQYAQTQLIAAEINLGNIRGALAAVREDVAMMRNALTFAAATKAALEAKLNNARADLEAARSLVRGGGA